MPTDPFVSPTINDAPRHRQNLPAGVAYPPSRAWTADRPGDVGVGQPHGRGLGNPGPNVGYGYTLAQRAKGRLKLADHEHADDAIAVIAELAGRRAARFGRAPVISDIDFAITLLGYDGSASDDFVATRASLIHEAAHHYSVRRAVIDSVRDDLIPLRASDLGAHVGTWRASLGTH